MREIMQILALLWDHSLYPMLVHQETDPTAAIIFIMGLLLLIGAVLCLGPLIRLTIESRLFLRRCKHSTPLTPSNLSDGDEYFRWLKLRHYWLRYREDANRHKGIHLLEPLPYFAYQQLIEKDGHRRFAEVLPGTFTGLGILGTFLGLAFGLHEIDVGSTETLRESINLLLGGMEIAFLTSIVGVTLSVLWTLLDRFVLRLAEGSILRLHDALAYLLPVPTEADLLERLVETQKDQLATFKSFVSDSLIPDIVTGFKEVIRETLTPHMEKTNHIFEQFSQSSSQQQMEGIERMVNQFGNHLNNALNGQMDALANNIKSMIEWQKTVKTELSDLIGIIAEAGQKQQECLEGSQGLLRQMEQTSEKLTNQLNDTSQKFLMEIDEVARKLMTNIDESSQELVTKLKSASQDLFGRIEAHIEAFNGLKQSLAELQDGISTSTEKLTAVTRLFNTTGNATIEQMEKLLVQQEQTQEERQEQIEFLLGQLRETQEFWNNASTELSDVETKLNSGIRTFSEQLQNGLQHTFSQYDDFLAQAVERLQILVSSMNEAVSDLPDEMERVERGLRDLQKIMQRSVIELENRLVDYNKTDQVKKTPALTGERSS